MSELINKLNQELNQFNNEYTVNDLIIEIPATGNK